MATEPRDESDLSRWELEGGRPLDGPLTPALSPDERQKIDDIAGRIRHALGRVDEQPKPGLLTPSLTPATPPPLDLVQMHAAIRDARIEAENNRTLRGEPAIVLPPTSTFAGVPYVSTRGPAADYGVTIPPYEPAPADFFPWAVNQIKAALPSRRTVLASVTAALTAALTAGIRSLRRALKGKEGTRGQGNGEGADAPAGPGRRPGRVRPADRKAR